MTVCSVLLVSSPLSFARLETGMDASLVLGQPDFTSNTANNGGIGAATLSNPYGVASDGKRLFVADTANNRILIWDTIPTSNFARANVVVGQPNFTASAAGLTASTLDDPLGVFSDGKRLFVVEDNNNRVLIWNSIPTRNSTPADVVVGQPNFTSNTANNGGIGARTLNSPQTSFSDGKRLFVVDQSNNRVLIWNSIPTQNFTPADVVVGQPNFTSNTGAVGQASFDRTQGVFSDGQRLFISDNAHRVLIWNSIPTKNFTPADVVLGQPNFTSSANNNGGIGAATLFIPGGIFSDGKRLLIDDSSNNRVVIWNTIPTQNFTPADIVLGQPSFTSRNANTGPASMSNPFFGIFFDGKRIFVGDVNNNRVLIYNLAGESAVKLGPQFEQGKAVLGKVFEDLNGNGSQDRGEKGIEGVKVTSDTGIYAITDEDGKYHFPFIETGQRVLKIDPITLPEGAQITTDNPYKIVVTKGMLTKVSFGVVIARSPKGDEAISEKNQIASSAAPPRNDTLLKVSISQDPVHLQPKLGIQAKESEKDKAKIIFTITCNYFLFIERSEITLYDKNLKPFKTIQLPKPLPLEYEIDRAEIASVASLPRNDAAVFYYQLSVYDKQGRQDRTGVGQLQLSAL